MDWLNPVLLGIFVVHLVVFGLRASRSKSLYDFAAGALFGFLVISYALKMWAPYWQYGGIAGYLLARYVAWFLALFTVPQIFWRLWQRFRKPDPAG